MAAAKKNGKASKAQPQPKSAPARPPLTAITLQGFKSFRDETRIEIRPLTLLAGANSSGKSSAIQPLLLLKQTLEAPYDPGPLLLDGPNESFTEVDQLLWRGSEPSDRAGSFSVALAKGDETTQLVFAEVEGGSVQVQEITYRSPLSQATLRPSMTDAERRSRSLFPKLSEQQLQSKKCTIRIEPVRCTLRAIAEYDYGDNDGGFMTISDPLQPLLSVILDVIHVPGLRGNPSRAYETSAVGRSFAGHFQHYMASVIAHWGASNDENLVILGDALRRLGLAFHVEPRRLSATQIELRVTRFPTPEQGRKNDTVNIADVGFGVSQTLPVVVALLAAAPGQVVYLEQPEIHLHPRAQVAIATLLADAAKRGVIVIAETHSDLLLRSVLRAVAAGEVDPSLVALHWFERDKDGATKVTTGKLDAAGTYGDWPVDFDDVDLKLESAFLDASLRHPT